MKYSVVIPLKNEENNIGDLIAELEPIMHGFKTPWELICINDGSTDSTRTVLATLEAVKPYLRVITFDRNYGQSSAFDAGFRAARGEFIITMDGDGQNDPADIPTLLALAPQYDLVCGKRKRRKDSLIKKITSFCANRVRSRVCRDGVQDTGCSLKVYRRSCFDEIKMFNGMHRFLPALFSMEGFRLHEVPVNHRPRLRGKSNYNFFNRSLNTVWDMFAVAWMRSRTLNYRVNPKSSNTHEHR